MDPFIGVKYKLTTSENFESYLKFINVGFFLRKTALAVSPVFVLTCEDELYTLTVTTSFKNIRTTFKLNEEFDEERADGSMVKSIFTVEGNKLIQLQTEPCGRKSKFVREFTPDKVTVITTAEGWNEVCIRVYERID